LGSTSQVQKGFSTLLEPSPSQPLNPFPDGLLKPKDIAFDDADNLTPGKEISVPAMYKIWDGKDYVVDRGDSLSRIAQKSGQGIKYQELLESNKKFIDSADRIYPIQLFDVPKAAQ
jgi:LysM repeat protein